MQLQPAARKKAKIKMALQGPSGSGKTKSALLIAFGLCGSWEKVAVIDSENRSADLYADLGNYFVLPLSPPYSPERYMEAIGLCLKSGIHVIIIDSISHEWEGAGGILETHAAMIGNSFTNWSKLTPRHNAFVQALLQADAHVISTIRAKQEYVLSEKNGKQVPEKVGLKGITRDGLDYEFTVVLDVDVSLKARTSKDRTQLFFGRPEFIPSVDTGALILKWCNTGSDTLVVIPPMEDILQSIQSCKSNEELLAIYNNYPACQEPLAAEFSRRRRDIALQRNILNQNTFSTNGTHSS